jgi:hypothetical protein
LRAIPGRELESPLRRHTEFGESQTVGSSLRLALLSGLDQVDDPIEALALTIPWNAGLDSLRFYLLKGKLIGLPAPARLASLPPRNSPGFASFLPGESREE